MQAVIVAGGFGTRLRPLTLTTSKPLIPVFGRSVLEHQILLLKKHGFRHVILCLNYRAGDIQKYFQEHPVKGIRMDFAVEPYPYGTAGAVKNAEKYITEELFVVFNGDVLMDVNVSRVVSFFKKKKAKAVLLLKEVSDPSRYGLVLTNERLRITQFLEKPSMDQVDRAVVKTINAGFYVLDRSVLAYVPEKCFHSFERDVFPALLSNKEPFYGLPEEFYWIDVGTPDKYFQVHEDILHGRYRMPGKMSYMPVSRFKEHSTVVSKNVSASRYAVCARSARIEEGVELSGTVVLGERSIIRKNAKLKESIVLDGSEVGSGSVLNRCIIGRSVRVHRNAFIENAVIADRSKLVGARGM